MKLVCSGCGKEATVDAMHFENKVIDECYCLDCQHPDVAKYDPSKRFSLRLYGWIIAFK